MGSFFSKGEAVTGTGSGSAGSGSPEAMPSAEKRQKKEETSAESPSSAAADSSSEDSSTEGGEDLAHKVPFRFTDLVDEVESVRRDPPTYVSRVGALKVPSKICNSELILVTPPEAGPWVFTLAVSGGESDKEVQQLAEQHATLSAEAQKIAASKVQVVAELKAAKERLEEIPSPSSEAVLQAACSAVQAAEDRLAEVQEEDRIARAAAERARAAQGKVACADAYNHSFVVALQFDSSWPVKPPTVRFQGVMHHALVDESGGMLMPFFKSIPKDDRKVHSLRLILEAIHHFLIDPLHNWGISRESAPSRLLSSMLAEEKMNLARLTTIRKYALQVKHKELFESPPRWREEWFDPAFWKACTEKTPEAWRAILVEQLPNEVFSFKIFTDEFLNMFVEEIFNFYSSGLPARRPNSMNNYGIILNEIGLEPMIDELQQLLQPLGELLWGSGPGTCWDGHHCFIVRYREGEDLGLDMHTDDSDVTFNICLGLDFEGAGLQFCGIMGAANHRKHTNTFKHLKGHCVVHLGRKRHGADDISRGERLNIILWNHSSTYRKSEEYEDPPYEREEGAPDEVCVSFTHDRDYGVFKEYPVGKEHLKGRGWCPPKKFEYADFKPDTKRDWSP